MQQVKTPNAVFASFCVFLLCLLDTLSFLCPSFLDVPKQHVYRRSLSRFPNRNPRPAAASKGGEQGDVGDLGRRTTVAVAWRFPPAFFVERGVSSELVLLIIICAICIYMIKLNLN